MIFIMDRILENYTCYVISVVLLVFILWNTLLMVTHEWPKHVGAMNKIRI